MAWLYRQPGSENWWVGYRVNGKQIRRSTETSIEADAKKELAKIRALFEVQVAGTLTEECFRALTGNPLPRVALKGAVEKWVSECNGTTARGTLERYTTITTQFLEHVSANDDKPLLREISSDTVQGFLNELHKTLATGSVNLARKVLATFFNRCIQRRELATNPVKGTKRKKATKGDTVQRRAYTVAEVQDLHAKAPSDFWRFMVVGGLYSGLRMGDLIQLRRSEIELAENVLRLTMGKVGEVVEVPMAAPFRALIQKRLKELGTMKPGAYLWPEEAKLYQKRGSGPFSQDFYQLVLMPCGLVPERINKKKAKGKNGRDGKRLVNDVSFHSLRHSFVTFLKMSGATSAVAKELAGHSSDVVNDLYTHVPAETMQAAIKLLPAIEI